MPGFRIPKMCGWEGAIDGTHTSSDMIEIINMIFFSLKDNLKFILIDFKRHRNRKCLPLIEISNQNV